MPLDVHLERRRIAFGAPAMNEQSNRALLVAAVCTLLAIFWSGTVLSQTAIRSNFDHDSTSFRLDGAHVATNCGDCHRRGNFASTLRQCEYCHTQGGIVTATFKPARHINTTQRCDACHSTRGFIPLERMDHNETYGDCVSCHDNNTAFGKPVDHPLTTDQCQGCHLTVGFSPVLRIDHTQALGTCSSCHNGVTARGKDADHIPTTAECDSCHNTVAF